MGEPARRRLTLEEYFALERAAEVRHEFVDGVAYAMAGGSEAHGQLGVGVAAELRAALRGSGCRVYSSEVRIGVVQSGEVYYPDTSVVCGPSEHDLGDPDTVTNPIVIVEVLSTSTEGYDRGRKWKDYRTIPSLRHYLLVSQREVLVEHYQRHDDGGWLLFAYGEGETIHLKGPDLSLSVNELYRDVVLEARIGIVGKG